MVNTSRFFYPSENEGETVFYILYNTSYSCVLNRTKPSEIKWLFVQFYLTSFPLSTLENMAGSAAVRSDTNHGVPTVCVCF